MSRFPYLAVKLVSEVCAPLFRRITELLEFGNVLFMKSSKFMLERTQCPNESIFYIYIHEKLSKEN